MQLLLQQLPALVGVVLGALSAFVATSVRERAQWRRAQSVRWDERRLKAYLEYAHAVKRLLSSIGQVARESGLEPKVEPCPSEASSNAVARAEEERTIAWEAVLMFGSSKVVDVGRKWHETVFKLQTLARPTTDRAQWLEALVSCSHARRDFYIVAKTELGIAIGDSPASFEWQQPMFFARALEGETQLRNRGLATPDAGDPAS